VEQIEVPYNETARHTVLGWLRGFFGQEYRNLDMTDAVMVRVRKGVAFGQILEDENVLALQS